jgi:hypothetical protein
VLEKRLGRRAVNAACEGGIAPLTYFLLKRALDAGARPTALLLDAFPTQLQADPHMAERLLAEALEPGECLDLAWTARDLALLSRLMASRLIPSVASRLEIRGRVASALAGHDTSHGPGNRIALWRWRVNRGAGPIDKNPAAEQVEEHWDEKLIMAAGRWSCHPLNAAYLKRSLDLAAERGIPVYWLLPPITARLLARRDRLEYDTDYYQMIERALSQYPNLTVIDGRRSGYPARVFFDGSHLDVEGAYTFTDALAETLSRLPAGRAPGPRWVPLPPYRAQTVPRDSKDPTGSFIAELPGSNGRGPQPVPAGPRPRDGDRLSR